MHFILTDSNSSVNLTKYQAHKLELALNKSEYGHQWKYIGDALYDFSIGRDTQLTMVITTFQLDSLKKLMS